MLKLNRFLIIIFFAFSLSFAQVLRETRAVWVATNFQLDWPPKTFNSAEQKAELEKIFADIKSKNLNTIYFQVRSNGCVLFNSSFEPYPFYMTGVENGVPDFDPLEYAVELAHKRGMQIHAWVNVFRCFSSENDFDISNPKHLAKTNPGWIVKSNSNGKNSGWLDPGRQEVRAYLIELFSEIVKNYNIDGLHLDFMRYPGEYFKDAGTYENSGTDKTIADWRRDNINRFLKILYTRVKEIKPEIKLGVTPLGINKNIPGARGLEGYTSVYQDFEEWIQGGYVDYLVPQIYWDIETNPKFDLLADYWKKRTGDKNIILGIAAYKPEVKKEIDELINISRGIGADGVAFFRYRNIENIQFEEMRNIALPSIMPWISEKKPEIELKLDYEIFGDSNSVINFNWNNQAKDFEEVAYFILYSVPAASEIFLTNNILATVPSDKTSVSVKLNNPRRPRYRFALKALSKLYNLSDNNSNIVEILPPEMEYFDNEAARFVNPVLIKENGGYKLLIMKKRPENIEVYDVNGEARLILSENLEAGKNILTLPQGLNYKTIKIIYCESKKEIKLNL